MKINIWSDIRCPFCYIGKHKFEAALEKFPHKDHIEITWKSFELDPHLKTQPDTNPYDYLAVLKGVTRENAEQMNEQVAQIGKGVGLTFNFEKTIVANSFKAHQLIQLAKTHGLGDAAEERLFKAHFEEGKNIDDAETLIEIGVAIGLEAKETKEALTSNAYAAAVRRDESEAQAIGVRGVPFFVLNNKYGVSGAQSPDAFLEVLEKSWEDFKKNEA